LAEVASTLRIPAGTAKSRLNRALTAMRGAASTADDGTNPSIHEEQPA
jgi:DNA-directed RNA polymerase specialized sigma24 family protein